MYLQRNIGEIKNKNPLAGFSPKEIVICFPFTLREVWYDLQLS